MASNALFKQDPGDHAAPQVTAAPRTASKRLDAKPASAVLEKLRSDPTYQGYLLLRTGFAVAPILFGLDKFANVLVDWQSYLAPWIAGLIPVGPSAAMRVVGVVEIAAGIFVAVKPRYGAYVVAAWLGAIILNLLTYSGYYDVALRDFGLMIGALTLGRLAAKFDPPGFGRAAAPAHG